MNENTCVCCGAPIPEGCQTCWECEHGVDKTSKPPSDKQIELAEAIANLLELDFPTSSKDFTAAVYWKFINDHIEEARSCWDDDESRGGGFYDDLMYFSPINQD